MLSRPSETLQASTSTFIGAVLIVAGQFFDVSKFTPQVTGAIVLIVGYVAPLVTAYVSRKQRDVSSNVSSAPDGSVTTS